MADTQELTPEQLAAQRLEKRREWRREYQRKWRLEHPDRYRELNKICMRNYRRKLREQAVAVSC